MLHTNPALFLLKKYKYWSELRFWKRNLADIEAWCHGEVKELYERPSPARDLRATRGSSTRDIAVLTWFEVQKEKYLLDLGLKPDSFAGMKLLDIGSGPFASALAFQDCEVYCLDSLLGDYLKMGYPVHYYDGARFIQGFSEFIPISGGAFDAVISVNAMDHVDNLENTSLEIRRVLKPGGRLRMHLHYHRRTRTEPIEMNDLVVAAAFSWRKDFHKVSESNRKMGTTAARGESFTLWSTF